MPGTEAARKASRKREALEGPGEKAAAAAAADLSERKREREGESGCISDSEVRVNTFLLSASAQVY